MNIAQNNKCWVALKAQRCKTKTWGLGNDAWVVSWRKWPQTGEEAGRALQADTQAFVESLRWGTSQTQLRPAGHWGWLEWMQSTSWERWDEAGETGKGQTIEHLCAKLKSLNVSLTVTRKSLKGFKLGKCLILYFKSNLLAVTITRRANFSAWKRRLEVCTKITHDLERFQIPSSAYDFPDERAESSILLPDLRRLGCKAVLVTWSLKMQSPWPTASTRCSGFTWAFRSHFFS